MTLQFAYFSFSLSASFHSHLWFAYTLPPRTLCERKDICLFVQCWVFDFQEKLWIFPSDHYWPPTDFSWRSYLTISFAEMSFPTICRLACFWRCEGETIPYTPTPSSISRCLQISLLSTMLFGRHIGSLFSDKTHWRYCLVCWRIYMLKGLRRQIWFWDARHPAGQPIPNVSLTIHTYPVVCGNYQLSGIFIQSQLMRHLNRIHWQQNFIGKSGTSHVMSGSILL